MSHRHGTAVAVVFIDLDRFKQINDTFGHAAGDIVLVEVAKRMLGTVRDSDTLARLAGDEFVLLCEELPRSDVDELSELMTMITDRIVAVLTEPIQVFHLDLVMTASIGVAIATADSEAEDLLHDADTAMYRAKESPRGRAIVRANPGGRQLERELVHALDRGQLRVHYQPIVGATDRRVVAVEALLRWQHPEYGLLPAADFISQAESSGAIRNIGRWVLDQACGQLRSWQQTLDGGAPDTVFCNLSPRELTDAGLDIAIASALSRHQLKPAHLGLEIVEDDLVNALLLPVLGRYQQHGHPLSVDDFGTGYSSLSRLVDLPVAYAKIDRAFTAGLPDDPRCRALVDAVLVVAANLNLRVIGEGVENEQQAQHLRNAGCHLLQGFYIALPMAADEVEARLAATVHLPRD